MTRVVVLCALAVLLAITGCATNSQPVRYFTLEPVVEPASSPPIAAVVAVGPVDVPDYLDRPQIVTRRGGNELLFDEFNRWGGPLDDEVNRLLVRHLGKALGRTQVLSYPSRLAASWDLRVVIELKRFDGKVGGDVLLLVNWSLMDEALGEPLLTRQGEYVTSSEAGGGYAAYVQALSRLAGQLAEDLADAAREVDRRRAKENPPQGGG